jgi:hypothetical protein
MEERREGGKRAKACLGEKKGRGGRERYKQGKKEEGEKRKEVQRGKRKTPARKGKKRGRSRIGRDEG